MNKLTSTSSDASLIEASFIAVAPLADQLVDNFFCRLFHEHPLMRPLFSDSSFSEHRVKIVRSLGMIVRSLHDQEALTATIRELGYAQLHLGIDREHYPLLGQTLLKSLAETVGKEWTPELHDAWQAAFLIFQTTFFKIFDDEDNN